MTFSHISLDLCSLIQVAAVNESKNPPAHRSVFIFVGALEKRRNARADRSFAKGGRSRERVTAFFARLRTCDENGSFRRQ